MFTGIVEEMGSIHAAQTRDGATRFEITAVRTLEGTEIGDSVAVNGVCLTVVERTSDRFAVEAVPETLRRTNLGQLTAGSVVNLERAVSGGGTFGGHYVQGHVDTVAEVVSVEPDGEAKTLRFRVPSEHLRLIVEKGYVALDGTSLTVTQVYDDGFAITLIPHTQTTVTLGSATKGALVNLELDVMGKYVERLVSARLAGLEERLNRLERQER